MTDSSPPPDEPTDSIQFAEWLEQTAAARGLTREELLEHLISSYWTLNEMSQMIQGSEDADEDAELFAHTVSEDFVPATRAEFEGFEAEVNERIADLGTRMNALETEVRASGNVDASVLKQRIDNEFTTIRKILRHLIDATEANEADLDAIEERIGDDVSAFREEYRRVAHLKQQAMSLSIDSGDCSYCGTSVDLSMLSSPTCPNCGRTFVDVEPRKTVLGFGVGSNVLRAETPSAGSRTTASATRDAIPDDEEEPDEPDDGFQWGFDRP